MTGQDLTEHSFPERGAKRGMADGAEAEKMEDAMTEGAETEEGHGRRAVQEHLIARLEQAGFVRKRGVTLEAHEARMTVIAEKLSYMDPDKLDALADELIDLSGGKADWPSEVLIMHRAQVWQPRPLAHNRALVSWLGSVEGPKALGRGDLVEVYRFLRKYPRPPFEYEQRGITQEAEDNARGLRILADKRDRGASLTDAELRWEAAYLRDKADAMALVEAGQNKRGAA
jgi:hypothetical protein